MQLPENKSNWDLYEELGLSLSFSFWTLSSEFAVGESGSVTSLILFILRRGATFQLCVFSLKGVGLHPRAGLHIEMRRCCCVFADAGWSVFLQSWRPFQYSTAFNSGRWMSWSDWHMQTALRNISTCRSPDFYFNMLLYVLIYYTSMAGVSPFLLIKVQQTHLFSWQHWPLKEDL